MNIEERIQMLAECCTTNPNTEREIIDRMKLLASEVWTAAATTQKEADAKACDDLMDLQMKEALDPEAEARYHDCIECAFAIRSSPLVLEKP